MNRFGGLFQILTRPLERQKSRTMIAKSIRSRFDMYAAGSTACPSNARRKEVSDWCFLEAA
jgi:hypothetical protein